MIPLLALLLTASDVKKPYRVDLVVDVARSRLLTDVFRQQVERELRDGLQAALGPLARVSVTDKHPLLADAREKGLDRAVGAYRERGDAQTHFVRVAFDGAKYDLQTRMHDGLTGHPAAAGRSTTTRDRAFVARLAALLVEKDLAISGTVLGEPDAGQLVKVELRGGELGDLARWITPGSLFSVTQRPKLGPGQVQPFLFLQATRPPENGVVECRVHRRYRTGPLSGMVATLLGTRTGPLRLRFMQDDGPRGLVPLRTAVTLEVRRHGFDGENMSKLMTTARGGVDVNTAGRGEPGWFQGIAFVTVKNGEKVLARVPVPLLDDGVVTIPLAAVEDDEGGALDRFRLLVRNVLDAQQVQNGMFEDINNLTKDATKRAAAITRVKEALARLKEDHDRLKRERDALRPEIEAIKDAKLRPDLKLIGDRLDALQSGEKDLLAHVQSLEKIDREEKDPKRKEWLGKKTEADALVKKADVPAALAIYRSAPEEFRNEEYQTFLRALEAKWKPKGPDHERARKFIYEKWGGLNTAGVKANVEDARTALRVCLDAGDEFGPARLRELTLAHATRMGTELAALKPEDKAEDEAPATAIKELVPEMRKLVEDADAGLKK